MDIPIINDALTEPGGPELVVVSVASVIGQPAITPGVSATVQIIDEPAGKLSNLATLYKGGPVCLFITQHVFFRPSTRDRVGEGDHRRQHSSD